MATLRSQASRIRSDCVVLSLALRHPATPWYARLCGTLTLVYALSPIDLIPDFIPVLGHLDDLLLVPLGIWVTIRLIPDHVWRESAAVAAAKGLERSPSDRRGAVLVVAVWLLCLGVAVVLASRLGSPAIPACFQGDVLRSPGTEASSMIDPVHPGNVQARHMGAAPAAATPGPVDGYAGSVEPPCHASRNVPLRDDAEARARAINKLLRGHTGRREERQILDILNGCEGPLLDSVLKGVDVTRLIHAIDDHGGGLNHRTELLDMLTVRRLDDLSVNRRAAVLDGLQYHGTSALSERAIRGVFLGTRGADLTALKNRVDAGGDYRDLQQLLFHDVDDAGVRGDILAHIAREARTLPSAKVISDIDDTFYRNWTDPRYPAKTVYPGVRQLYRELDLGPNGDDPTGDLTFISARPGEPSGISENATHDSLRERGIDEAVVLTGALGNLIGNEAIAAKKHENFAQYRLLYPEYAAILLGDSGQGDIIFGERAIASDAGAVLAVLINDVVDTPAAERDRLRGRGVILNDTYVDAAVEACQKGLISREGLQRVADAAVEELAAIRFDSPAQRAARQAEHDRALARVAELGSPPSQ